MDLNKIALVAEQGGFTRSSGLTNRMTPVELHALNAGLVASDHPDAPLARVAATAMRRWLVQGGTEPPPIRGGSFLRSDGEVWIAYTSHDEPAIVRGKASAFSDLHRYLSLASHPAYDGSAGVRTKPALTLDVPAERTEAGEILLRSELGVVQLDGRGVLVMSQWLAASIQRGDRKAVLCLPGAWQPDGSPR